MDVRQLVDLVHGSCRWPCDYQADMVIDNHFDAETLTRTVELLSGAFRGMVRTISLENYAGEAFPALSIGHLFPAVEKISFISCQNLTTIESISGFRALQKLHAAFCPQLLSVYCSGKNSVTDLEVRVSGSADQRPADILCDNGRIRHCRIINTHYSHRTWMSIQKNTASIVDLQMTNSRPSLQLEVLKRTFPNLHTVIDTGGNRWARAGDLAKQRENRKKP